MEKLKHCPFCGNKAEIYKTKFATRYADSADHVPSGSEIVRIVSFPDRGGYVEYQKTAYVPRCCDQSCIGRIQKRYESEDEAAFAWNRRAKNGK